MVLFGPLQSYSVHIGLIRSMLSSSVHFSSIRYRSVYSIYFGSIRSTSVYYVLFGFHKACVIEALTMVLPNNSHGSNSFYNVFRVSDNTTPLSVCFFGFPFISFLITCYWLFKVRVFVISNLVVYPFAVLGDS